MARYDYPEKWSELLTRDIPYYLNSNNEKGIYSGLLALFGLVKKYEFELEDKHIKVVRVIKYCGK